MPEHSDRFSLLIDPEYGNFLLETRSNGFQYRIPPLHIPEIVTKIEGINAGTPQKKGVYKISIDKRGNFLLSLSLKNNGFPYRISPPDANEILQHLYKAQQLTVDVLAQNAFLNEYYEEGVS